MNVLVVESPAKAKTINKYLGSGYKVLASFGHIRDLPSKDGSVKPDDDFAMIWEVDARAQKQIKDIADAVKGADKLILATDPDREGEAISWHVLEVLQAEARRWARRRSSAWSSTPSPSRRSSTPSRIRAQINEELVDAYLARRALDYLVGFTLSPVLWRKLPGARSAGRVQSVALRLVCERETGDRSLQGAGILDASTPISRAPAGSFTARLTHLDGKKLDKLSLNNEADADARRRRDQGAELHDRQRREPSRSSAIPAPPFITSTLQQEASRKLGFGAKRTMQIAQQLYEGVDIGGETVGLITYMRTDGVTMAGEAITEARARDRRRAMARAMCRGAPRVYTSKAKNAQEAHEAIRPTSFARTPEEVARYLDADAGQALRADLEARRRQPDGKRRAGAHHGRRRSPPTARSRLRATGTVTLFDGFLTLYQEGKDDEADEDGSQAAASSRPAMRRTVEKVTPAQHFTEPPPRYSEASLVRKLEELGIGRPSTYASILSTLRDRAYVRHGPQPLHSRRQGPPRHRLPATASSSAMSNMISPPIWKRSSTRSPTASSTGSSCCAISGRISPPPSARPRI